MMGIDYIHYNGKRNNKRINFYYTIYVPKMFEEVFNESQFNRALQEVFENQCQTHTSNNMYAIFATILMGLGNYEIVMDYDLTINYGLVGVKKDGIPIYIYTQGINYNDFFNEYERLVKKYVNEVYN
ncbi:MAG: hypothetical protein II610_07025 [Treponema sp.]|nr:hypothetical protein [Treponema sp.]